MERSHVEVTWRGHIDSSSRLPEGGGCRCIGSIKSVSEEEAGNPGPLEGL